MHTPSLADYVRHIEREDWENVGALMLASAHKLARAGADFLICPDNTIHAAFDHVWPHSPLPWLHIADVVADEALRRGFQRLGLTGTRWLVESDVYPERLSARGLTLVRPTVEECGEINRITMVELVRGVFTAESLDYFRGAIDRMKGLGCDAVILGCTEHPVLMNDANSPLPTLDSSRLLARAALRRAVADDQ